MNKSGGTDSKYGSLVVKTNNETSFDLRWSELKIDGKNIPSRSNHVAGFFNNKFYIHGGYDADKGVLSDFYCLDVDLDVEAFEWKKLNNMYNGNPIKLKSHRAITYKTLLVIFGGEAHTNQSINDVYTYDFVDGIWKMPKTSGTIPPKIDSHSCCQCDGKLYIYGGYMPETAEYLKNIYALDLETMQWSLIHQSKEEDSNQPEGRSNFDLVLLNQKLWIFGGTNGQTTLCDFWSYDLKASRWEKIQCKNIPQARRGHSMVCYKDSIFLFGGIQDITKQKNDVYVFQIAQKSWNKIHTSTNSIYDCSPTLKQSKRSPNKSPDKLQLHKISPEKDKNSDVMKKILNQNKQKKFMEKKKQLLKQFSQKPNQYNKTRSLSPTTQSMLKTLQSIGNQEVSKKQLKQEIMYDQSHRFIIGKKPCARDGQTVTLNKDSMYIFGGDRHLMAFNDLYCFDLEKGLKSMDLYRST